MAGMTSFPPKFWRDRAEEARVRAEQIEDALTKQTMELIADAYDCLAELTQSRLLSGVGKTRYPN